VGSSGTRCFVIITLGGQFRASKSNDFLRAVQRLNIVMFICAVTIIVQVRNSGGFSTPVTRFVRQH
jgi:hypothetical protein